MTILLGVIEYNELYETGGYSHLGVVNIIVFFGILLLMELAFIIYKLRKPEPVEKPDRVVSLQEFRRRAEKEQLVLLDDLILDVSKFKENHPGGQFLLEHNIGRDISKFFYGGYALDNNDVKRGFKRHAHTSVAYSQLESLIVGRLVDKEGAQLNEQSVVVGTVVPSFIATIKKREPVNSVTNTITFDVKELLNKGGVPQSNLPKRFYKDVDMIGKHFLISDSRTYKIKRHYTISNCMEKAVYL